MIPSVKFPPHTYTWSMPCTCFLRIALCQLKQIKGPALNLGEDLWSKIWDHVLIYAQHLKNWGNCKENAHLSQHLEARLHNGNSHSIWRTLPTTFTKDSQADIERHDRKNLSTSLTIQIDSHKPGTVQHRWSAISQHLCHQMLHSPLAWAGAPLSGTRTLERISIHRTTEFLGRNVARTQQSSGIKSIMISHKLCIAK